MSKKLNFVHSEIMNPLPKIVSILYFVYFGNMTILGRLRPVKNQNDLM